MSGSIRVALNQSVVPNCEKLLDHVHLPNGMLHSSTMRSKYENSVKRSKFAPMRDSSAIIDHRMSVRRQLVIYAYVACELWSSTAFAEMISDSSLPL